MVSALRRLRAARPALLAMAVAVPGAPAASAPPPPDSMEVSVTLAARFMGAVDRLVSEGALKGDAYRLWKEAGYGFLKIEHAAWIVVSDDLELSFVGWPRRRLLWKEVWKGPMPPNAVAIIHTHPDSRDPQPSDQDAATARAFGIPNYAVSRLGIWKATPSGEIVKVDGEAWFVRCAGERGCGVKEPSRAAVERPEGRALDGQSVLP